MCQARGTGRRVKRIETMQVLLRKVQDLPNGIPPEWMLAGRFPRFRDEAPIANTLGLRALTFNRLFLAGRNLPVQGARPSAK